MTPRPRTLLVWAALLGGVVLTTLLDHAVWSAWHPADDAAKAAFERRDLVQMLRSIGYIPTWVAIAAAGFAIRFGKRGAWHAWLVALSAALGGGLAELMKLILARERPGDTGEYVWRGVFSGFSNPGNLGLASSHAGVAFGGACMILLLWPRATWVALPLAIGCAIARVGTGAHYLSDVWVGGVLGYVAALLLFRLSGGRKRETR